MSKYLVTGGAGFIGSNIVKKLLENGETVRVLDDLSTGKKKIIELFLKDIEFIEGKPIILKPLPNMNLVSKVNKPSNPKVNN